MTSQAAESVTLTQAQRDEIQALIARRKGQRGALIPLLHDVQEAIGWVPDAVVPMLAEGLNLSRADVHGVLTFYHDFRRAPAPARVVKICRAEACQARGGAAVETALRAKYAGSDIAIEPIYCLGLCASGPSALVDGVPVGHVAADTDFVIDAAQAGPARAV